MSSFYFKIMSLTFMLRDLFLPRKNILKEVGIEQGHHVLDYGCGPGSYVEATAQLVGESGKLYALDEHPLAISRIQDISSKKRITNIEAICSNCETGLPDASIDVVLLYDIFHLLRNPMSVLHELHRVLKPKGILSFSDHHIKENEIIHEVTHDELFRLLRKGKKTYSFLKD